MYHGYSRLVKENELINPISLKPDFGPLDIRQGWLDLREAELYKYNDDARRKRINKYHELMASPAWFDDGDDYNYKSKNSKIVSETSQYSRLLTQGYSPEDAKIIIEASKIYKQYKNKEDKVYIDEKDYYWYWASLVLGSLFFMIFILTKIFVMVGVCFLFLVVVTYARFKDKIKDKFKQSKVNFYDDYILKDDVVQFKESI